MAQAREATGGAKDLKGRKLGGYTVLEHLETGGMAEIFLARHEGPGGFTKNLVLKTLQGRYADDPLVVKMFLEEARIGALLNHPSIVDVHDAGEEDGVHFIAMEHIPGQTLTEVVRRGIQVSRPLSRTDAAYILAQVADALAYMQDGLDTNGRPFQIVHRDISPSNILIGQGGQVKLIDFGIARQGRAVREESGARPGKVAYMSPEQVRALPLDGRSDLFSLGIILYEITLGRRLFRGAPEVVMKRIVEDKPPPPTYVDREFPPALELAILRALEKRPEDRYRGAEDMYRDLDAYLATAGARSGNRLLGDYVRALFDPEAPVSEAGARRARAFMDDEGVFVDEELDLDRRSRTPADGLAAALQAAGPLVPVGAQAKRQPTPGPVLPGAPMQLPPAAPVPELDPASFTPSLRDQVAQASALSAGALRGGSARKDQTGSRDHVEVHDEASARTWAGVVVGLVLACAAVAGLVWTLTRH